MGGDDSPPVICLSKFVYPDTIMRKWFVRDCDGREIYLTEEQWKHIFDRHNELMSLIPNNFIVTAWGIMMHR